MKTSTRVINTTLCTAMLAFLGTGLVLSGQAWAAQEVEPTTQLPKKKVLIKSELRGAALPAPVSTEKQVKSSGNVMAPIRGIIDGEGGAAINMNTVDISASGSITPAGVSLTITPDVTLPLSAWTKVECNVTTKYFPTVTGNQPNDDIIKTTPTLTLSNNAITFVCPHKTQAHVLNSAKSVAMPTSISIFHSKNGMDYKYSGTVLYFCERATKTTATWTCS